MLVARLARQTCLSHLRVQSTPHGVNSRIPLRAFHSKGFLSSKPAVLIPRYHIAKPFSTSQKRDAESETGPSKSKSSPGVWSRLVTCTKYGLLLVGSTIVGVTVLTTGIFLHDAFTYNEKVCQFCRVTLSCHSIQLNMLSL